jgi:hypothetical protein
VGEGFWRILLHRKNLCVLVIARDHSLEVPHFLYEKGKHKGRDEEGPDM